MDMIIPATPSSPAPCRIATTSERLQQILKIRKVSQADIAHATGIRRGTISNYVLGKYEPKLDVLRKLSSYLNCSEMWLQGYDVPINTEAQQLTEQEYSLVALFRRIPADRKQLVLEMLHVAAEVK